MTATLMIDLVDAEGYELGRTVPVFVDYITTVDRAYGEDADGRQGEIRFDREILDVYIEAAHVKTLTSEQAEQVLDEALEQFANRRRV